MYDQRHLTIITEFSTQAMYGEIFTIIAPVFLCALIGYGWGRSGRVYQTEFVTNLVMGIGAPCLIVGTLSTVALPAANFNRLLLATVMVMSITLVVSALLCRLVGLSLRTYLPSLSFPNSGNIGLPLCLFAFGEEGLALGLGIFLVMSLVHFSLGLALVSGKSLWRGMLRSPIVYASLLAAAIVYLQWQLPPWLGNTLKLLGDMSIPLMLITLGVSLARLRVTDVATSLWARLGPAGAGCGGGFAGQRIARVGGGDARGSDYPVGDAGGHFQLPAGPEICPGPGTGGGAGSHVDPAQFCQPAGTALDSVINPCY